MEDVQSETSASETSFKDKLATAPWHGELQQMFADTKSAAGDPIARQYRDKLRQDGVPDSDPVMVHINADLAEADQQGDQEIAQAMNDAFGLSLHVRTKEDKSAVALKAAKMGVTNNDISAARNDEIVRMAADAADGITFDDVKKAFANTGDATLQSDLNDLANGANKRKQWVAARLSRGEDGHYRPLKSAAAA